MTVLRSREISPSKIPPKKTLKTPTNLQPSTPSKNDLPSLPPPSAVAAAAVAIPLPYRRRRTPRFAVAEAPILNPAENSRRSTNRSDGGVGDDDDDDDDRTVKRRIDDAIVTAVPEGSSERRLTREEKGKEVLVGDAPLEAVGVGSDTDGLDGSAAAEVEDDEMMEAAVAAAAVEVENNRRRYHYQSYSMNQQRLEIFRAIAKRSSTKFALFNRHDEEEEEEAVEEEEEEEEKDWPGPFSTVERIMEDQELLKAKGLSLGPKRDDQVMKIDWSPSSAGRVCRTAPPSLLSLSMRVLANNAGEIETLRGVPDVMRHKLSQLLCRSRRMDCRFLRLLFEDRPSEVRVEDSSWISEEQLYDILSSFDSRCLKVLQLDQCARCMPDYVLCGTLARSPNSLPALTTLSLTGVARLTDDGLQALVTSAPSLRSINLSGCSLITSDGVSTLIQGLSSVLEELYIDDCQSVDAMMILPVLKKLKNLEVLSVARVERVCDKFIRELVSACGLSIKALVLEDCRNLTVASIKAIGEKCSNLRALDISKLHKLRDVALQHLANGCRTISELKLCGLAISDESVAAYIEASGESLVELSLNGVKEVAHNTATAIGCRCSLNLQVLDLSFCREMTDEALGLIVDSCSNLVMLKLFGCSQVTDVFLDGHSNSAVKITGPKSCPILEHTDLSDF